MSKEHLYLGRSAEDTAADLLRRNGYKILARNYKTKLGEIDIIAKDKDILAFVEVKARHTERFGAPAAAVIKQKQRQIAKSALVFLKENKLLNKKARFDVVSVSYANDEPKLDLIKDAFVLDESFTY